VFWEVSFLSRVGFAGTRKPRIYPRNCSIFRSSPTDFPVHI